MKRGAWQKLLVIIFFVGNGVYLFGGQAQVAQAPAMNPFFMGGGYGYGVGNPAIDPRNITDRRMAKLYGEMLSVQTLLAYQENLTKKPNKSKDEQEMLGNFNKRLALLMNSTIASKVVDELTDKMVDGVGKVAEKHVERTLDRTLGCAWDYAVDQILSLWNNVWILVCCDNQRPFTDKMLVGWQELVLASFDDLKHMLNEDIRDRSRACDVTMRQADDQTPDAKPADTQTPGDAGKGINVWKDLIGSYAMQFDYLVTQIDKHKGYYDEQEDSLIVSYAEQIKRQLLLARNLLVSVNSLQGLDAAIGTNRAMVDAMRNSFDTLFKLLRDQVRDDKSGDTASRPTTSSSRSSKNDFYSGYGSMGSAREREL